ncbi:uncharacterized protein LOC123320251 [Coccinella septempunctata]|uniref:uncharacterized protein LOC123320251 n=1 Tax=Coccinella septempunctata TaxID=41139 RepID=UPI001D078B5C|nr:uncharacterized protein LOC123320251 [Coccinella septempunctata]
MSVEFLFKAIFICTSVFNGVKGGEELATNSTNGTTTLEPRNFESSTSTIFKDTSMKDDNSSRLENATDPFNLTQVPLFLNLIINLNFMPETAKKKKKYRKSRGRSHRKTTTTEENPEKVTTASEDLGSVFQKIKLKMELQRKKRNIVEYQNNAEDKSGLQNGTKLKNNRIQDIMNDKFPKMSLLNDDKELDVTKWLKNWKDILAVNPIIGTEKPTKPEVEYIDEWKYSYRVTLYNSDSYNISNFLCSGILVSPQWVLTSVSCNLGEDVTLLIGVHTLPKNISDHNRYGVLKKVYSLNENLELMQMDRPVQWNFKVPDIRAVKMEEMESLLRRGKCNLLSWIPVDFGKGIFELRQYPQLTLLTEFRTNANKNAVRVFPLQPYRTSRQDVGSPVLCDDVVTGILLDVDEDDSMTVELLCPVLEWITFFTREGSYFEVTARKLTLRSSAPEDLAPGFFLSLTFCHIFLRGR